MDVVRLEGVDPPLPLTSFNATVKRVTARGVVRIVAQPYEGNLYTLMVDFDDNSAAGPADYVVDISFPQAGAPPR